MLEFRLRDGRKFKLAYEGKEEDLVRDFELGMLPPKQELDLKEHGKVYVGHILEIKKVKKELDKSKKLWYTYNDWGELIFIDLEELTSDEEL